VQFAMQTTDLSSYVNVLCWSGWF